MTDMIPGTSRPRPKMERPIKDWRSDKRLAQTWMVNGEKVRLYTIGAVCAATGKKPVTVRKWLQTGVIPEPTMRAPVPEKSLGNKGRRLWTENQVQIIGELSSIIEKKGLEVFKSAVHQTWQRHGW